MGSLERRGWAAALSTLAVAVAVAPSLATARNVVVVPRSQQLALLLSSHRAMSAPNAGSTELQTVSAARPITGERTLLPVLARRTAGDGVRWLEVLLPGRPNGHAGWIRQRGTTALQTHWHIVVSLSARRVSVFRDGLAVRVFDAVVGKPATPTPYGEFFVEESVQLSSGDVGAPFALALSARSNVLQQFDGGPGQIALHGLANVGGTLGTAASHGCLRLAASTMRWLVARIGPGVPVTITE